MANRKPLSFHNSIYVCMYLFQYSEDFQFDEKSIARWDTEDFVADKWSQINIFIWKIP